MVHREISKQEKEKHRLTKLANYKSRNLARAKETGVMAQLMTAQTVTRARLIMKEVNNK